MTIFTPSLRPKFMFTFKWALIVSLITHLIALYVYTHTGMPDPIDIPPTEVKIKIGSSGVLSAPPIDTLPKQKKSSQTPKPVAQKTDNNHKKTQRNAKKTQELKRKQQTARASLPKTASGSKKMPKEQHPFNAPNLTNSLPQIAPKTSPSTTATPVAPRKKEGQDNITTPTSDGYEYGTKSQAIQKKTNSYEEEISTWINSKKFLPQATQKKLQKREVWEELTTTLFILIEPKGDILEVVTTETSGYTFIDNLAIQIARKASPLPPIPPEVPTSEQGLYQFFITLEFPAEAWQPSIR